jgi:hypothetical protein
MSDADDLERKPVSKYKEWCAEVIGDGIGDDDGFCEERKSKGEKWYLEPCVKLSGAEAIDGQDENFDETKLIAIETALESQTETLNRTNQVLAEKLDELGTQMALADEIMAEDGAPCEEMELGGPEDTRREYRQLQDALVAATTADAAYNMCTPFAGQTSFGFNAEATCAGLAIVDGFYSGLWESVELIDDSITSARLDNAVTCLGHLKEKMQGVQSALDYKVEWRRIHLNVIEVKEKREFLVNVTEAGRPAYVETYLVRVSGKDPVSFIDITDSTTWTEVYPGTYLVEVELPQSGKNADVFSFEVAHFELVLDDNGEPVLDEETNEPISVEHSGSTLFDRSGQNTICTGQ